MPPIRELFFAILVLMILSFGAILWVGGVESENGLTMSNTIASNYNALSSNTLCNSGTGTSGLFGNLTKLCGVVNSSASNVTNVGSSSSTALTNSVGLVVGYLNTLPILYGSVVNFIAVPFEQFGVPTGYAQVIVNVMFVGIIALAIVSAIFLFPV